MSTDKKQTGKSWFFMDYSPKEGQNIEEPTTEEKVEMLASKLNKLETEIIPKLESLETKLDKLIQSNKNLIEFFSSAHNRDIRELNYCIRSFPQKKMPPVKFVPSRHQPRDKGPAI